MGEPVGRPIPLAIANRPASNEGDCVALASTARAASSCARPRRRYELSELVARITPKNRHRETDWGEPQARILVRTAFVPEAAILSG